MNLLKFYKTEKKQNIFIYQNLSIKLSKNDLKNLRKKLKLNKQKQNKNKKNIEKKDQNKKLLVKNKLRKN